MTIIIQPLSQPRLIANALLPLAALAAQEPGAYQTDPSSIQTGLKAIKQDNVILLRCRQALVSGEPVLISQEQAGVRLGVERVGPDEQPMPFHVIDAAEEEGWIHILTADEWAYFYKLVDRDEACAVQD